MQGASAGRSKLEFSLAVAIIAVVSVVLLDRLLRIEEAAEKLAVELTVRNMRSGMQYRQADLIVRGLEAELPSLGAANPVTWLAHPPPGYVGERAQVVPAQLGEGEWVFSTTERRLYYRPRLRRFLTIDGGGELLSWRTVGGAEPAGQSRPGAVRIDPASPYSWAP